MNSIYVPFDAPMPPEERIEALRVSIKEIGLLNPLTVQWNEEEFRFYLIAGRTRFEALKRLKWDEVNVIQMPPFGSTPDAEAVGEMARIAENLHRREIDDIERGELIIEWSKLREERNLNNGQVGQKSKTEQNPRGAGRSRGGISQTARELNLPRKTVARVMTAATLSPEAKQAARNHGLGSNQSALLEAAKETEPVKQVATIEMRAVTSAKSKPSVKSGPHSKTEPIAEASALHALKAAWKAAGEAERESFVRWIGREP